MVPVLADRFSPSDPGPLYLVGDPSSGLDALEAGLDAIQSGVETVAPGQVPGALDGHAVGVVCLAPSADDGPREGDSGGLGSNLDAVAAAGVDCPVIAVGADVDAAAAYDAGATDVVPLAVDGHAGTVADRVAAIVDRHRTERELAGNRDLLDALSTAFPDYAFVYDEDGRYLDVVTGHRSDERLYAEEELVGRTVHEFLDEGVADRVVGAVRRALETDEIRTVEYPIDHPDGKRWYEGRVAPLPEPYEGRPAAVLVTRDVTERRERERELERYETLFETVRDKLYVIDEDGYIEMVSEPLAEAVGYAPDELRGQHISTVVTEETRREGESLILDLLVTPDSVSSTYEGTLVARDGEETPIEIELSILPYEDSFRGSVGAVRDISERRRRERELGVFRQAITEAGVGLAMYGTDGRFEYVNDHYANTLGTTRGTLESRPVWESFGEFDRDGFDAYVESFAAGETRTTETEHRRVDGSTVPVETVTTAVTIEGTPHHVVTIQEITGRRERRQQTEVLHRVLRHNLRNDLTVVVGHAEYLADRLDGREASGAETIIRMADRLMDLTDTARDAEEIIERDTVRRPVEVVDMLRSGIADLRAGSDAVVETDLPDRQHVLADSPLEGALGHVLANAVEHNDGPTPHVWVRVAETTDRSGWVTVEVADDGPGIPEHERSVLTAGEETPLRHGSGLGLWIVHWVVTRYGGELEFEEREGGGSVVRISLPAADPPDDAVTTGEPADADTD